MTGDEQILPECVSAEVVSGDNKVPAPMVKVRLDNGVDGSNSLVRVATDVRIDEPVVAVTVVVGCGVRTARRFVAFVDPPGIAQALAGAPEVPAVVQQSARGEPAESATAPRPAARTAAASAAQAPAEAPIKRRTRRAANNSNTVVARAASAAETSVNARRGQTGKVLRAERDAAGPRLKLDAPVRLSAAELAASAAAAAARQAAASEAAQSLAQVEADLRAQERQRLKTLEDSITRLRNESAAMQQSVSALQAQLAQAQTDRYANPLVYSLAGLCALLAAAVGALLWRQSRMSRDGAWWNESAAASLPRSDDLSSAADGVSDGRVPMPATEGDGGGSFWPAAASNLSAADPAAAAAAAGKAAAVVTARHAASLTGEHPAYSTSVGAALMEEPRREVTVEELMDLEQQADFFLVLGQEDAAIELLTSHVRSTGGSSPLPFLKLMEIYFKRGEHEPYLRLRERFNQRFNAVAPDWGHDPQSGLHLEDYPAVVERLQAVWPKEADAMALLESLLFRRDVYSETFELPAYVELLMLYGMARELLDQPATGGEVDLLLPLGGAEGDAADRSALVSTPFSFDLSPPDVPLELDLDIGDTVPAGDVSLLRKPR